MATQLSESGVRDLLNHVCTFLQYLQYNNTVTALLEERAAKRQALNSSVVTARVQTRDARDRLRAEMVGAQLLIKWSLVSGGMCMLSGTGRC